MARHLLFEPVQCFLFITKPNVNKCKSIALNISAGRREEVQTEFAIGFPLASRFGLGSLFPTIQTLCPYRPAPHIRQRYIVRSLPLGCISLLVLLFSRLRPLVSLQPHT